MRTLLALSLLLPGFTSAQDTGSGKSPEEQALLRARARLNAILIEAQAQKEKSLHLAETGRKKLESAERILAKARENPDDPDSGKVKDQAPAVIEKARRTVAEAEASLRRAEQRIRLTESAIRNLKDPDALPKPGVSHELLQRLAVEINGAADTYFSTTPGYLGDRKKVERIDTLVQRLLPASMDPSMKVKIRIVDSRSLGGFARATGDAIYVWNGYLDKGPTEEELIFLLAHELAHVQRDHSILYYAAVSSGDLPKILQDHGPDHAQFKKSMADVARRWEDRRLTYSREQETEADLLGLQMSIAAGGSLEGVSQFLGRCENLHRGATSGMTSEELEAYNRRSTHPSPAERRASIEALLGTKIK